MKFMSSKGARRVRSVALVGIAGLLMAAPACAEEAPAVAIPRTPAPEGAAVYLISPEPGAIVHSPLLVRFGLRGMGVAPAGVQNPKAGHHHLIIDAPQPAADRPIPADDHHRHFGGGQTEVEIELGPGKHTLQLVLGDHLHVPHDPPIVSEIITITVE